MTNSVSTACAAVVIAVATAGCGGGASSSGVSNDPGSNSGSTSADITQAEALELAQTALEPYALGQTPTPTDYRVTDCQVSGSSGECSGSIQFPNGASCSVTIPVRLVEQYTGRYDYPGSAGGGGGTEQEAYTLHSGRSGVPGMVNDSECQQVLEDTGGY